MLSQCTSASAACGVLRPEARWSTSTARCRCGSNNCFAPSPHPEPGPPCTHTTGDAGRGRRPPARTTCGRRRRRADARRTGRPAAGSRARRTQRPVAVRQVAHEQSVVAALVRPRPVPAGCVHHHPVVQTADRALHLVEVGERIVEPGESYTRPLMRPSPPNIAAGYSSPVSYTSPATEVSIPSPTTNGSRCRQRTSPGRKVP